MSGRFKCGAPSCERTFDSSSALLRHCPSCLLYRQQAATQANFRCKRLQSNTGCDSVPFKKLKQHQENVIDMAESNLPNSLSAALLLPSDILVTPECIDNAIVPDASTSQTVNTEHGILLDNENGTVESNVSGSSPAVLLLPSLSFSMSEHVESRTVLETSTAQTVDAERLGGLSRPVRSRCLPARFRDILPELSLPPLPETQSESHVSTSQPMLPHIILHVFDSFRTSFNKFGIAHYYRHRLSYDPDAFLTLNQLSNTTCEHPAVGLLSVAPDTPSMPPAPPWPWKNMGIWRLMTWMMTGSRQKSEAEVTRLVREVIQADDFDRTQFHGFNAHTEMNRFDKSEGATSADLQDAWKESPVDILVPT
ncbi:hypothetical protein SCLCIDRAFT_34065 [Scleroderma citrinum Foug A]|uniref:Uncharacterized protein n=1 Tax=Scleroderma citrinum Foug A TaxID=1036808 RepID=A0A0C2ZCG4_9AGAM|nr:hypothetical protein SCLCIDRAFT_34065 [Scleroderma citrinum Foug A]